MFQGLIHEIKNSKIFHFMDGPSAINKKKKFKNVIIQCSNHPVFIFCILESFFQYSNSLCFSPSGTFLYRSQLY